MNNYQKIEDIRWYFVVEEPILTIGELETFVSDNVHNNYLWRGLNDASYTLQAKSYIDYQTKGLYNIYDGYTRYLSNIYEISRHIRQGVLQHIYDKNSHFFNNQQLPFNPIWVFSIIQHYATGTPLIDWTNNMWSALFFAWYGAKESPKTSHNLIDYIQLNYFEYDKDIAEPAIPVGAGQDSPAPKMTIMKPNCMSQDIEKIREDSLKCIYYVDSFQSFSLSDSGLKLQIDVSFRNPRSDVQNGFFILHLEERSLEEKWDDVFGTSNMRLHKVLIHKSLVPQIECLQKDYWGENLEKTLLPKEWIGEDYDVATIAELILKKAQSKAKF